MLYTNRKLWENLDESNNEVFDVKEIFKTSFMLLNFSSILYDINENFENLS